LAWLKMVVVKTDAQQTVPTLRRMRRKLVKFRALLMKCGEVIEVALAEHCDVRERTEYVLQQISTTVTNSY